MSISPASICVVCTEAQNNSVVCSVPVSVFVFVHALEVCDCSAGICRRSTEHFHTWKTFSPLLDCFNHLSFPYLPSFPVLSCLLLLLSLSSHFISGLISLMLCKITWTGRSGGSLVQLFFVNRGFTVCFL